LGNAGKVAPAGGFGVVITGGNRADARQLIAEKGKLLRVQAASLAT
jgi:hypothetical protein